MYSNAPSNGMRLIISRAVGMMTDRAIVLCSNLAVPVCVNENRNFRLVPLCLPFHLLTLLQGSRPPHVNSKGVVMSPYIELRGKGGLRYCFIIHLPL